MVKIRRLSVVFEKWLETVRVFILTITILDAIIFFRLTQLMEASNLSIILALSKMGIYMERDRKNLDLLTPEEQNVRLQNALDRAIENCCIFPLLFSKAELGDGKLVLLKKPQWTGWREDRTSQLQRSQDGSGLSIQSFVTVLGEKYPK